MSLMLSDWTRKRLVDVARLTFYVSVSRILFLKYFVIRVSKSFRVIVTGGGCSPLKANYNYRRSAY